MKSEFNHNTIFSPFHRSILHSKRIQVCRILYIFEQFPKIYTQTRDHSKFRLYLYITEFVCRRDEEDQRHIKYLSNLLNGTFAMKNANCESGKMHMHIAFATTDHAKCSPFGINACAWSKVIITIAIAQYENSTRKMLIISV